MDLGTVSSTTILPGTKNVKLDGHAGALMTLPGLKCTPGGFMCISEGRECRQPLAPPLPAMLKGEAGHLGDLLGVETAGCSGALLRVGDLRQRRMPVGKASGDRCDAALMLAAQHGINGRHGLPAFGNLAGCEKLALGNMHREQGASRGAEHVAIGARGLDGLPVFEGSLARPFQGSRYWSRSQPLPLSRSFQ